MPDDQKLKDWRAVNAAAAGMPPPIVPAEATAARVEPRHERSSMQSLKDWFSQFQSRATPQPIDPIQRAKDARALDEWELATTGRMSRDIELPAMESLKRGR